MEVRKSLHMNTGEGESSYAKNSFLQETVILKTLPVLKHTIKDLFSRDPTFSHCFRIADLGCSSSKNTLLVAFNIINIVDEACKENDRKAPQFEVCLNDLYGNDFNSIFKLLPDFYAKLKKEKGENFGPCFVLAVPGSFYSRLFPDQSLHLVHSSYSLHWLSQVPEGLEDNRLNIYLGKTSPPNVFQAYEKQFDTDFTMFLQLRSKEIVHGGRMVLALLCRSMADSTSDDSGYKWKLLAQTLVDMVEEVAKEEGVVTCNDRYALAMSLPNQPINGVPSICSIQDIAYTELAPLHPTRLGLALNFSVFYYDILNIFDCACSVAQQALNEAITELVELDEDSSHDDIILILRLIRENLTMWKFDMQSKTRDELHVVRSTTTAHKGRQRRRCCNDRYAVAMSLPNQPINGVPSIFAIQDEIKEAAKPSNQEQKER